MSERIRILEAKFLEVGDNILSNRNFSYCNCNDCDCTKYIGFISIGKIEVDDLGRVSLFNYSISSDESFAEYLPNDLVLSLNDS